MTEQRSPDGRWIWDGRQWRTASSRRRPVLLTAFGVVVVAAVAAAVIAVVTSNSGGHPSGSAAGTPSTSGSSRSGAASSVPRSGSAPGAPTSTGLPLDPIQPVRCSSDPGDITTCFPHALTELVRPLTSAGYRCGKDDFGDEACTRTGIDKPTYTFRGPPDSTRAYEVRFTVDVEDQGLPTVQARVLKGLPRLSALAFPGSPDVAGAAMRWFTAHRPGSVSGAGARTHGELRGDFTLFCHASQVGINAEGLPPSWTTTMECGINTASA